MEKRFLEGKADWKSIDIRECAFCRKEFVAWDRLSTKFCSLECRSKQRRKYGKKVCAQCSKVVARPAGKYGRFKNEFCSRECEGKFVQRVRGKRAYKRQPTSAYKGVCKVKGGKWMAAVRHEGVLHYLGRFTSERDAAIAYNKRAAELFGPDAFQNTVS